MGFMDFFRRKNRYNGYGDYGYWNGCAPSKVNAEKPVLKAPPKPKVPTTTDQHVNKGKVETRPIVPTTTEERISERKVETKPDSKVIYEDQLELVRANEFADKCREVVAKPNRTIVAKYEQVEVANGVDAAISTKRWTSRFYRNEEKNVIIFAFENSDKVNSHKAEILQLVKKIVQDNASALFLFMRLGKNKRFFGIMNSETIDKGKIIDDLLFVDKVEEDKDKDDKVNYKEALNHINDFLDLVKFGALEYKEKKYDIPSVRTIFVGTAEYGGDADSKAEISKLIGSIKASKKAKILKYFCMEDKETINAARLGFPVIGHIVSDFYK